MANFGGIVRGIGEGLTAFTTGTPLPQVQRESRGARLGLQTERDTAALMSIAQGAEQLKQIQNPQKKLEFLRQRQAQLKQAGLGVEDTEEAVQLIQQGRFAELDEVTDQAIELGQRIRRGSSASPRAFAPETIRKVTGKDAEGNDVFGLFSRQIITDPGTQTSKVIETPIEGDLVTSTGETITQQRTGEVEQVRQKKVAEITASSKTEAKQAPLIAETKAKIAAAVKIATTEAAARGEALTDLTRMEASLPGLRDMVSQLKELAPVATSTLGGRVFDVATKELGFGSTKGSDARAKFVSIINNQVLPLLKPTFGAAFTVSEGEALKATMGDPNATPSQKLEQINSFIDQKVRNLQGVQREIGVDVTASEELETGRPLFSAVLNRNITEDDITETLNSPDGQGLTREQLLQQLQAQ